MLRLDDIKLSLLISFVRLHELRSVTEAARSLGVTQSAMSHNLRQLREVFDDPLFVRSGRGLAPTVFADEVVPRIQHGLAVLRSAVEEPPRFEPATSERVFRIAASDYFEAVALGEVLKVLAKSAPRVELEVLPYSRASLDALRAGEIEVLAGSQYHEPGGDFRVETVYRDPFVCVERRRRGGEALTLERYLHDPQLVLSGPAPTVADGVLQEQGRARWVRARISSLGNATQLIASTRLLGTLPLGVVARSSERGRLVCHPVPVEVPAIEARMYWHPRFDEDEGVRWLRAVIREACDGFLALAREHYPAFGKDKQGRRLLTPVRRRKG